MAKKLTDAFVSRILKAAHTHSDAVAKRTKVECKTGTSTEKHDTAVDNARIKLEELVTDLRQHVTG